MCFTLFLPFSNCIAADTWTLFAINCVLQCAKDDHSTRSVHKKKTHRRQSMIDYPPLHKDQDTLQHCEKALQSPLPIYKYIPASISMYIYVVINMYVIYVFV